MQSKTFVYFLLIRMHFFNTFKKQAIQLQIHSKNSGFPLSELKQNQEPGNLCIKVRMENLEYQFHPQAIFLYQSTLLPEICTKSAIILLRSSASSKSSMFK
jgi:hypothetical protein